MVIVFDEIGFDGDIVSDDDGKMEGKLVEALLESVPAEPFGTELILDCLKS